MEKCAYYMALAFQVLLWWIGLNQLLIQAALSYHEAYIFGWH